MRKPTTLPTLFDDERSAFIDGFYNGLLSGASLASGAIVLILQFLGKL